MSEMVVGIRREIYLVCLVHLPDACLSPLCAFSTQRAADAHVAFSLENPVLADALRALNSRYVVAPLHLYEEAHGEKA